MNLNQMRSNWPFLSGPRRLGQGRPGSASTCRSSWRNPKLPTGVDGKLFASRSSLTVGLYKQGCLTPASYWYWGVRPRVAAVNVCISGLKKTYFTVVVFNQKPKTPHKQVRAYALIRNHLRLSRKKWPGTNALAYLSPAQETWEIKGFITLTPIGWKWKK
jgi:hypothetical protein